jgi:hypothetical protein
MSNQVCGIESNKDCKVRLTNFGLTCRGPSGGPRQVIIDRCPQEIVIDLDTARLRHRRYRHRNGAKLILNNRCIACHLHYGLMCFLKFNGLEPLGEHNARATVCTTPDCIREPFHGYSHCPEHLSHQLLYSHNGRTKSQIELFRETFKVATRRQWTFPPRYEIVRSRMAEIAQGKRPGTDLIILDDEFSPASQQLWEFAMIEQVSGKVLINTTIDHGDAILHNTLEDSFPF